MLRFTIGRLTVSVLALAAILGTTAATSAVAPPRGATRHTPAGAGAGLIAYGRRSPAQQRSGVGAKLDAALADIARHSDRVRPGSELLDLKSLNPAARFMLAPQSRIQYVAVDAITRGDPQALKGALVRLGMQHATVYLNDVGGWLPVTAISSAVGLQQVLSLRAAMSRTNSGAVTSQGDYVQGTAALRTSNPSLTGTGITVGILSDSYDCYAAYAAAGVPALGNTGYATNGFSADAAMDISTGDLPASSSINILEEAGAGSSGQGLCSYDASLFTPNGDEGRAMMQIVHDVAPGAGLAFYTAVNSEADMANGIAALASGGAQVIADDVIYFDEPFFQDGLIAQAVDTVNAAGVAYFSAAGNNGSNGYDNLAPSFGTPSTTPAGEMLLNFDTTGATTTTSLSVNVPQLQPGDFIAIVLEWDQPYVTGAPTSGGATGHLDLCVTGSAPFIVGPQNPNDPNSSPITDLDNNTQACTGVNALGVDPYQILVIGFPATATAGVACPAGTPQDITFCSAPQTIQIQVGYVGGTAPGRIKLSVEDDGAGVSFPGTVKVSGPTLQGHPGAAGAMGVGAVFWYDTPACGTTPALLETYSAQGGTPILFDSSGTRLATPVTRQKPDIAGPDGGNDTFLGFQIPPQGSGQCANITTYPNFFGTSAATPHVAATAALLLQQFPGITPSALYATLKSGALTIANGTLSDGNPPTMATNFTGGYGFIQAESALSDLPSAPNVTLNLNPTTINVGDSATLSWTVTNANSCTASGAWSGAQSLTGSLKLTPSSANSYSYTLTCFNDNGNTADTDVLTVVTSGGGGGGALDLAALLAIAGLAAARLRRRRT